MNAGAGWLQPRLRRGESCGLLVTWGKKKSGGRLEGQTDGQKDGKDKCGCFSGAPVGCSWVSPAKLGADLRPSSMSSDRKDAAFAGREIRGGSGDPRTSLARLGCPEGAPDPAARPGVGAARPGRRCREALIFANRSLISRSGPPAGVARARPSTPSKLRFGFPSWGEAGGARSCSPPQPGRYGVGGPWTLGGSQSVGSHVWPS